MRAALPSHIATFVRTTYSGGYPAIHRRSPYTNPKTLMHHYCFDPLAERLRLARLYEQAVQELDMEYWRCLLEGVALRDALIWLERWGSGPDGYGMSRWVEDTLFAS
ncbi:hypothetical protein B0H10DRAFT_679066 [Mycena sp. CBHHK59/15]|nr:hypothetical protein B0H10DRAFT_679066 [Mycena sp. CBHHK59/15]